MSAELGRDPVALCLRVEVPLCAFRPFESREYQDTYPVPTPSSVYGMLLSLVGVQREEKSRYQGIALSLAFESVPTRSRVFRKLRRGKDLEDIRPDYQDLLVGLTFWAWLWDDVNRASPPLTSLVGRALSAPRSVKRSGGVSLGESSYLVNSIREVPSPDGELLFLRPDPAGFHHLPVWVDHEDAGKSIRQRFDLVSLPTRDAVASCRISIGGAP